MKHLKAPTRRQRQKIIPWIQTAFRATYRDTPASEIPNSGLADSVNFLPFDTRAQGRHGTVKQISASTIPNLTGRNGNYAASKSGDVITKTSGTDFSADDVGNYFVWVSPDTPDLIIEFISTTQVRVDNSTAKGPTSFGSVRGKINDRYFHRTAKKVYWHLGNQVWQADTLFDSTTHREVVNIGAALPNSKSKFREYRGKVYLSTKNGIYLIDDSGTVPYLVQINSVNDFRAVTVDVQRPGDVFGRRYLTTYSRMSGDYFTDRAAGNPLIKESAPIQPEASVPDYGSRYYDTPITANPNSATDLNDYNNGGQYTIVNGAAITNALADFMAITNGTVLAEIIVNNVPTKRQVAFNLSGTISFDQVAEVIQLAIRNTFPDADNPPEFTYVEASAGNHFRLTGGSADGTHARPFSDLVFSSGTATSTTTNKLIDATANFITEGVSIGDLVRNTTAGTSATVSAIDSATQLTLSADIFPSAADAYTIESPNDTGSLLKMNELSINSTTINSDNASHVVDPSVPFILSTPTGQNQWTHYSVYGTQDVIGAPDQSNTFVWLFDKPIMKAMRGSLTADGTITLTSGSFDLSDVGTDIFFQNGGGGTITEYVSSTVARIRTPIDIGENTAVAANKLFDTVRSPFGTVAIGDIVVNTATGASTTVTTVDSTSELTLAADIFANTNLRYEVFDATTFTAFTGECLQMGGNNIAELSQAGFTVSSATAVFSSGDVGKPIFWDDGSISYITAFTSSTIVSVSDNVTRTNQCAVFDVNGVKFNDYVNDDIVSERISDFVMRNRFWEPLPNSDLMAFAPGFLFVACRDDVVVHYSQFSQNFEYLGGHYYEPFQNAPIEDRITGLESFPEQTIVYASRATWRINTNTSNIVRIPEVGEAIAVISGIALADGDIGILDDGGIQQVEKGQQIVITSEPGIRIFDGFNYSENLVIDRNGRPMFLDDLEDLHALYASAYDKIMGFIFWGVPKSVNIQGTGSPAYTEAAVPTSKCFRLGIKQEQARGMGELNGTDWIFQRPGVKSLRIFTTDNEERLILFDEAEGVPYWLDKNTFTDKAPTTSSDGTEITGKATFKEHKGERESWRIRHLLSHFYFRPQQPENMGASGYTALGLRSAQKIKLNVYRDGELTAPTNIYEIPTNGELAFDREIEANRVQLELEFTSSEYQLVEHDTDYTQQDTRALPNRRNVSWHDCQRTLGNLSFWLSRNRPNLLYNKVTGLAPSNGETGVNLIDGPDGLNQSALEFPPNIDLTFPSITLPLNSFTITFWARDPDIDTVEQRIISIGSAYVAIRFTTPNYFLVFNDGTEEVTLQLPSAPGSSSWHCYRVTKQGNASFRLQYDKNDPESPMTVANPAISGGITVHGSDDDENYDLFDLRVIPESMTQECYEYYYDDVLDKSHSNGRGGQKVLPEPLNTAVVVIT